MKKIILIPAAAGVLAFGGIVLANTDSISGPNQESPSSTQTNPVPSSQDNRHSTEMIGFERASAIALDIAEGNVTDIELSEDDGRLEYEVEIHDAEYEYDFDIEAFTGEVLEQDRERLRDGERVSPDNGSTGDNGQKSEQSNSASNVSAAKGLISMPEAKDIALKETGGGTIEEFELDNDDGLDYYDVEIVNGNTEFELEINAADGSVMKFEQDDDDGNDDNDDWDDDDNR